MRATATSRDEFAIAAQNGIQMSRARGRDQSNSVVDNTYNDPNIASATGILLFQLAGDVEVEATGGAQRRQHRAVRRRQPVRGENEANDSTESDGLFADSDSTGNRLFKNSAFGNQNLDCEDDSTGTGTAGTANQWEDNRGATADPPASARPSARTTVTIMGITGPSGN